MSRKDRRELLIIWSLAVVAVATLEIYYRQWTGDSFLDLYFWY